MRPLKAPFTGPDLLPSPDHAESSTVAQQVRRVYGASMSPDATAFAHLVDDGGYPRAVQRFLRGWRATSSRDVELPVEGPVTRVMHSADGYWLACQVAPEGGSRSQIWVVTTDPDDRAARRIDHWPSEVEGTAELISWDGVLVAAILTGEDNVGSSCLIDPSDGTTTVLDRRSGGRLVDAWAGASLIRVGPRGYRDLIMLRGLTENALLPYDPGSTTDTGIILDDHSPRRLRSGPEGEITQLHHPAKEYGLNSTEGYVRALVRSENGAEHARLLEVTVTAGGVIYHVLAERAGYEIDEFTVSDDLFFASNAPKDAVARMTASLRRMLSTRPADGANSIVVSHTSNLREAAGIWPKPEGVAIVFRPLGDGRFEALARIPPEDWGAAAGS